MIILLCRVELSAPILYVTSHLLAWFVDPMVYLF